MNAYRNGSLEGLSLVGWFTSYPRFHSFMAATHISNKDHELWYGDKRIASEMKKEDLEKKMHFGLKYLNVRQSKLNGMPSNYKSI